MVTGKKDLANIRTHAHTRARAHTHTEGVCVCVMRDIYLGVIPSNNYFCNMTIVTII